MLVQVLLVQEVPLVQLVLVQVMPQQEVLVAGGS